MQSRSDAWYSATVRNDQLYPQLEGNHRVDVVVVGGGLTGVASALELAERGYSVALVEAHRIGFGASGRNGGQITGSLSGDQAMLKQLRPIMGTAADDFVWNLRWRGHDIIQQRVAQYSIDCDLKYGHLHAAYKPSHMAELIETAEEASSRGMAGQVKLLSREEMPHYIGTTLYHGGLFNQRNMHVHSLNLCIGEARAAASLGVKLFEDSLVTAIHHGHKQGETPAVETAKGRIDADTVLLAGNAYHKLERRHLGGKLFPASLANLTTAVLDEELAQEINPRDLAVYDTRFVLDYYRLTSDRRLMFGGGTNYSGRDSADVAAELRPAIERTFPQLRGIDIDYQWTCRAGITINRIPQIGRLSDNVYFAQGYSGHGIATSHIMAEITASAIAGTLEEFDRLAGLRSVRVPLTGQIGDAAGQAMLTLGMLYYQVLERFR
ncbi:MAG: FAD-binding oxidoreductase [Granulosicoccus sp.]|nr:FAD-binding oxidoreductase [Granulosicoccus sp.]